jgi:predicted nucleotidyltransferase
MLGGSMGFILRELKALTEAGIIDHWKQGNQVLYQANGKSPIYSELRSLIVKTFGVADKLRTVMEQLADRVRVAFIYGSFANGEFQAQSDIDIFIVGEVNFEEVVSTLYPLQEELSREINSVVYPVAEFRMKLQEGQHFITCVVKEEKIFLMGDENELGRLVTE